MKQQASVQGVRCPVNCPVCHHDGHVFPARFRRISLPASGMIDRITNKSNHVLFLLDGAVHICQGRDNIYLQSGQCMFLARNGTPEIQATKPSDVIWLDFSNRITLGGHDCLTQVASEAGSTADCGLPILEMNPAVTALLDGLQTMDSPCWHILKEYELFITMASTYFREELASFFASILHAGDDFRSFVRNNYKEGDSLEDIARKANLSTNYFAQRFKQNFGMTPHRWLMKQKARKLLQMVASGCTETKVIVEKLGFKNLTGLYLFCRRNLGCTFTELTQKAPDDIAKDINNQRRGIFAMQKNDF